MFWKDKVISYTNLVLAHAIDFPLKLSNFLFFFKHNEIVVRLVTKNKTKENNFQTVFIKILGL